MKTRITTLLLCLPMLAIAAFAHNGMEHVMGTVKTISADSVTVETAAKDPKPVTIALLPSTKFVKSGANPLGNAAGDLTLHDHGVDGDAAVVDDHVPQDVDRT